MNIRSMSIGFPTENEKKLMAHLGEAIASWIALQETDRRELMAALFQILYILFDIESPLDLEGKLNEVDDFCYFMKEKIKGTKFEDLKKN